MAKWYEQLSPKSARGVRNTTIANATEVCELKLKVPAARIGIRYVERSV